MAAYSTCNWCLRDKQAGEGSPSAAAAKALTTARAKQRAAASRLNGSRALHDDKDRSCPCGGGSGGCSSRSAFPAEPQQKPVKKHKKSHERAAQRLATAAKGREVQTGGGARTKPPVRAKARVPRYKLLTEVIRCK